MQCNVLGSIFVPYFLESLGGSQRQLCIKTRPELKWANRHLSAKFGTQRCKEKVFKIKKDESRHFSAETGAFDGPICANRFAASQGKVKF